MKKHTPTIPNAPATARVAIGCTALHPGTTSAQDVGTAAQDDGSSKSLQTMPVPAWFDDGKIGILIHWGPYSAIGYRKGGWNSEMMQDGRVLPIQNPVIVYP
jgi:hypothetical protein